MALTGRKDWADDLAQAVCLRAMERANGFQAGTHLDRWVFRIAHNMWINELRSRRIRTGGGLVPVEDTDLPTEAASAESNIFLSQVLSAVDGLPEAQRVCVMLVYVEGYGYREAAEILDIPIGTVMSRLAAARSKLSHLTEKRKEASK